MKRAIALAVALTLVAGCSGGGINGGMNGGSLLPAMSPGARLPLAASTNDGSHRMLHVNVTMVVPKRHRREHVAVHPATISPLTRSVSFVINGGAAQVFNVTTSSPSCKATTSGTQCTFAVKAPPGLDTFIVTTYNAVSGGGTALDSAAAKINIAAGKANSPSIRLGPVVSTTADTGAGSLRYAIGSANSGDTILFTIPSTSTIHVLSPLTLTTNVSITGPGVATSAGVRRNARHPELYSDVTVKGLTITGGGTQQIFVIEGGVKATISGLILTDGLATVTNQPGGAIYNAGYVTLLDDGFTGNGSQVDSPYIRVRHHAQHHSHGRAKAPRGLHPHACTTAYYYGGALYNHGNMVVSGSTFASNVLQNTFGCTYGEGGAIYTDEYGTLTSSGNTYTGNSAYYGGAVYVDATYGQASFTGDTFTSNAGCTATTGCPSAGCSTLTSTCSTSYPIGDGAAIYDGSGPGVAITSSKFNSNVAGGTTAGASGEGGALDLETGSPVITGSSFTGNKAGGGTTNCSYGHGGAIYEDAGNTVELDGDTFTSNVASGDDDAYGGAIDNDANPDSGSGNKFTSNQAYAPGSACNANAEAAGGALDAYDGITMSGSTFSNNLAKANYDAWGGAINTESGYLLLTSDTFSGNAAIGTGLNSASAAYAYGGAIYADTQLRLSGSTFTSNNATAQTAVGSNVEGGAIYSSATFTSNGNTYTSNSASIPSGTGTTRAYGGAVYASSGTYIANGDKYSSNTASAKNDVEGGGLYVGTPYGLTNLSFNSNKVTATGGTSSGGALALDNSGKLSTSTFTGNSSSSTGYTSAYDHGGGAIFDNDSSSTIDGITVSNNTVGGGSGGGLYADANAATLNNSTISGNAATSTGDYGGGGGIYNQFILDVTNTTLSGNTATVNGSYAGGGGIYVDDTVSITGSTISGNKVTGTGTHAGGGGVFSYDDGTYVNDTISGNKSSADGGAVDAYSNYDVVFNNVTMYQNAATGKGGNIFNDNNTGPYVTLANTIVAGGTAGASGGADVYNSGTMTSMGYNIVQTAAVGGGTFTAATGDKTANPLLLGLANNGGPTFTNADQSTSPGKAYIPWTSASGGTCGAVTGMSVDQRGYTRGTGGKCDVGAYEYSGTFSAIRIHRHTLHPDPRKRRVHDRTRQLPPHERQKAG